MDGEKLKIFKKAEEVIFSLLIPCSKCGKEMFPILATSNKYKCSNCDRVIKKISLPPHNIGTLLWYVNKRPLEEYYNIIVKEIIERNKDG